LTLLLLNFKDDNDVGGGFQNGFLFFVLMLLSFRRRYRVFLLLWLFVLAGKSGGKERRRFVLLGCDCERSR